MPPALSVTVMPPLPRAGGDGEGDIGRDASLLSGVEGVVAYLLGDDACPLLGRMPGLQRQFLLGSEFELAAGRKRMAM